MNANDLMPKELISSADVFDAKGKPTSRSATIAKVIEKLIVGQGDNKRVTPGTRLHRARPQARAEQDQHRLARRVLRRRDG